MAQPVSRAFESQVEVDRAERTIVSVINTDCVDRYRTVILPDGGRFDNYRKNPVVLCNHDSSRVPIGKNLWIKRQKGRLVAKTRFLPQGKDELADKVFELYDLEFLNAWSISFDPIEDGSPTPDEVRRRPELADCVRVFRKWDLLEYSAVTVPGNPEAARQAIARGLALPGWESPQPASPAIAADALPPLRATRSLDQVLGSVERQLRESFGPLSRMALDDARDLARGKV